LTEQKPKQHQQRQQKKRKQAYLKPAIKYMMGTDFLISKLKKIVIFPFREWKSSNTGEQSKFYSGRN
jgi:hypothetical protein